MNQSAEIDMRLEGRNEAHARLTECLTEVREIIQRQPSSYRVEMKACFSQFGAPSEDDSGRNR
jgi:hypothetical protein